MEPELVYQELKNLAEKLDVVVAEQNLGTSGFKAKSGYCLIKNRKHCIIDKHLKVWQKVDILVECLSAMPHEIIFVVPAVRNLLERHRMDLNRMDMSRRNGEEKNPLS